MPNKITSKVLFNFLNKISIVLLSVKNNSPIQILRHLVFLKYGTNIYLFDSNIGMPLCCNDMKDDELLSWQKSATGSYSGNDVRVISTVLGENCVCHLVDVKFITQQDEMHQVDKTKWTVLLYNDNGIEAELHYLPKISGLALVVVDSVNLEKIAEELWRVISEKVNNVIKPEDIVSQIKSPHFQVIKK
ncbi:MAG: hypothetical protein AAB657_03230 [Patescibacteria group bacterium]